MKIKRMMAMALSVLLLSGCRNMGTVSGSMESSKDESSDMVSDMASDTISDMASKETSDVVSTEQADLGEGQLSEPEEQVLSVYNTEHLSMYVSVADRGFGLSLEVGYQFPDIDYNDSNEFMLNIAPLKGVDVWGLVGMEETDSAGYESGKMDVFYIDGDTLYGRRGNSNGVTVSVYYPFEELAGSTRKVSIPSPGVFISGQPCTVNANEMKYSYGIYDTQYAKLKTAPVLIGSSVTGVTEEKVYGQLGSNGSHTFINKMDAPDINTGDDWLQIYGDGLEIEFMSAADE